MFINFCPYELSFTRPSTIELTLDISSGSRYCLMYYTYSLCTIATAKKTTTVHVRSPVRNRPPFCSLCIFINFCPHELSFTGPSTIELALEISSAARYCVMYYTCYLSTAPLPSDFQVSQCAGTRWKRTVTGNDVSPDASCVLKH